MYFRYSIMTGVVILKTLRNIRGASSMFSLRRYVDGVIPEPLALVRNNVKVWKA